MERNSTIANFATVQTEGLREVERNIDYYNLDNKLIYTIGDGYSDEEMIKIFNGYAMKDSVEELKKLAKKEYVSVSELINEIR